MPPRLDPPAKTQPTPPARTPGEGVEGAEGVEGVEGVEGEDDELDDLPPIDGDGVEEAESNDQRFDDAGVDEAEPGGDSLDDSTGEDDPLDSGDLDGDERETGWLGEATDADDLDLGEPELLDAGEERIPLEDGEDPVGADDDFVAGEGNEPIGLDFAEEGPVDEDEELRDEDLPVLDADDSSEGDARDEGKEEDLLDERVAGDDPLGLPWAAEPLNRVGPPPGLGSVGLQGGVSALVRVPRGAVVAGRSEGGHPQLVRVDLEGGRQVLAGGGLGGARIVAMSAEGDLLAAVSDATDGGRLAVSRDGGDIFETVPMPEGVAAADVVVASGVVWVKTRTGSLLSARPGKVLERRAVPGTLVAIGAAGAGGAAGVFGLAVDEAGRFATLVRGRGTDDLSCEAVQAPAGRPAPIAAARGDHVAYVAASPKNGPVVRGTEGRWERFAWDGRVTALAFLDDDGTLLAAAYSETDDSTALVRIDPVSRGSRATVVARIGAAREDADGDGRVVALVSDDAGAVVWVAGGFGVAPFAIR